MKTISKKKILKIMILKNIDQDRELDNLDSQYLIFMAMILINNKETELKLKEFMKVKL